MKDLTPQQKASMTATQLVDYYLKNANDVCDPENTSDEEFNKMVMGLVDKFDFDKKLAKPRAMT
jgi:hypothetical protein